MNKIGNFFKPIFQSTPQLTLQNVMLHIVVYEMLYLNFFAGKDMYRILFIDKLVVY